MIPGRDGPVGRGLLRRMLRRGGEDDLTEHLAELLRVPALGRAFLGLMGVEIQDGQAIDVATQVTDPETRARPDLTICSPAGMVWVEAKLDAALTRNQPGGYIECLAAHEANAKHLVFIIKSRRWAELSRAMRRNIRLAEDNYDRVFHHQEILVTICTWREVRDCFAAVAIGDAVAAYLLAEFSDHVEQNVERKSIPLEPKMITTLNDAATLRAFAALEDLVTDLAEQLEADGHQIRHQEKGELRQHGFYVAPEGDKGRRLELWIGMIFRAGAKWDGKGPLWAWLHQHGYDESAEVRLKAAGFDLLSDEEELPDWADCHLVPLLISGTTNAQQVQEAIGQVHKVWNCATR